MLDANRARQSIQCQWRAGSRKHELGKFSMRESVSATTLPLVAGNAIAVVAYFVLK